MYIVSYTIHCTSSNVYYVRYTYSIAFKYIPGIDVTISHIVMPSVTTAVCELSPKHSSFIPYIWSVICWCFIKVAKMSLFYREGILQISKGHFTGGWFKNTLWNGNILYKSSFFALKYNACQNICISGECRIRRGSNGLYLNTTQ